MLERKAREAILEEIRDRPRIPVSEVCDLVRMHYTADIERLIARDVRRIATNLAAQVRDEDGRRAVFSVQEAGNDRYVNVDVSQDVFELQAVQENLVKQRDSRDWSIEKVTKRLEAVAPKHAIRA